MGSLDKVTEALITTRHALWLGAGISVASGVPTVRPLCSRILRGLGLRDSDIEDVVRAGVPFESLFEVLMSVADCTTLFEVFRGERPSLAHKFAARLAKHGLVRTILTTNFDALIEEALSDHGVEFDLFTSDEEFSSIDWASQKLRVIKLHGTIHDIKELVLTIRRVAARYRADVRGKVIRDLIENESDGGLVILGYSCSDHFDVSPAARAVARADRHVLLVSHDDSGATPVDAPLRESHPDNPFAAFNAMSVTCATENLLQATWQALCGHKPPSDQQLTAKWPTIVDSWLVNIDGGGSGGIRPYIAALVLKTSNLWERSNEELKKAIDKGLPNELTSRALLAMGNNYRDMGQHDKAEVTLLRAEGLARQAGQAGVGARILNSLGIVAEDKGERDVAIDFYLRALPLACEAADRELEGKCHGNLGIAYKNRGDITLSLKHHNHAYEVAVDIGDKKSEGRTLGNIGLVYRARGNVEKSCEYYAEARRIAESLGDLLHVGIWLHNSAEDMANQNPIMAEKLLQRAMDIFSALGKNEFSQQSEEIRARLRK